MHSNHHGKRLRGLLRMLCVLRSVLLAGRARMDFGGIGPGIRPQHPGAALGRQR
jgi:hypothetical protein